MQLEEDAKYSKSAKEELDKAIQEIREDLDEIEKQNEEIKELFGFKGCIDMWNEGGIPLGEFVYTFKPIAVIFMPFALLGDIIRNTAAPVWLGVNKIREYLKKKKLEAKSDL